MEHAAAAVCEPFRRPRKGPCLVELDRLGDAADERDAAWLGVHPDGEVLDRVR